MQRFAAIFGRGGCSHVHNPLGAKLKNIGRKHHVFIRGISMRTSNIASSLVALSLLAAPIAAQAAPAARAAAPATEESDLGAGGSSILWIVLAIAAVVGAILILDGDDDPVSP